MKVNKLECTVVADYGTVPPMANYLSWNWATQHYEVVEGVTHEELSRYVEHFTSAWERAD